MTCYRGRLLRKHQVFPQLEAAPDVNRGEQRLAAEVALATMAGEMVPVEAKIRAFCALDVLARHG